ncbi:hypothetical protein M569_11693 [Genlisea aurea]|uniref:EF-hand domain-containing protein n=1 Tax=Genlisea aurea TaxID=192259 RepID=S8DTE9_9LAMI|nr:hypothetical protein M569_11693 [Genlisea aurea]
MAITGDKGRSVCYDSKDQITAEEFKTWLMKFDSNKDGRISERELREAIRSRHHWFSWWKCRWAFIAADINGNGYIDEQEIDALLDYAEKHLGFKIKLGCTV